MTHFGGVVIRRMCLHKPVDVMQCVCVRVRPQMFLMRCPPLSRRFGAQRCSFAMGCCQSVAATSPAPKRQRHVCLVLGPDHREAPPRAVSVNILSQLDLSRSLSDPQPVLLLDKPNNSLTVMQPALPMSIDDADKSSSRRPRYRGGAMPLLSSLRPAVSTTTPTFAVREQQEVAAVHTPE